ncbi:MAG TPA: PHP domain-containing protein, partial [Friedmanniella sp.]
MGEDAGPVDPVAALREIGFLLERSRSDTYRVKAYRGAADALEAMPADERGQREAEGSWAKAPGVGPKTATVITQALAGRVPEQLGRLRAARVPLVEGGATLRTKIKGDLHTHSTWSDGGSPVEEMMVTARTLGHEYCVITDHSPRLTVARGLTAERLQEQMALTTRLAQEMAPFRVLQGIEVDIL